MWQQYAFVALENLLTDSNSCLFFKRKATICINTKNESLVSYVLGVFGGKFPFDVADKENMKNKNVQLETQGYFCRFL